jgi:hypothetical protein
MKVRRLGAVILVGAALGACATSPGGRGAPRAVNLPTPIACRADIGPQPDYPDTDDALRAAADLFERVRLLAAGRLMRMARERDLTAALGACEGP